MANMSPREMQEAFKAALKEWLDEKFAEFGRWSLGTFLALLVGAIAIFILHMSGWTQTGEVLRANGAVHH
jgi:hypothetical protein